MGGLTMNQGYLFDRFEVQQKKSEIDRLTKNVSSHSQALAEIFLNNGLIEANKVLDVGCGTGAMISLFSELMPDTEFVGVDNSKHILATAQNLNLPNATFVEGEATKLPFEDNTFDLVYIRLVLMHNPYPEHIISEMKRVCKPGGVMISVEIDDETMVFHPFSSELSHLIRANIAYAKQKGTDRIMGRKLFSLYKAVGIDDVNVITQTSDYNGAYDEMPFSLKLAVGNDEARHLIEAGLITEQQRVSYLDCIAEFCKDPNRFYSGSFMYCVGKK